MFAKIKSLVAKSQFAAGYAAAKAVATVKAAPAAAVVVVKAAPAAAVVVAKAAYSILPVKEVVAAGAVTGKLLVATVAVVAILAVAAPLAVVGTIGTPMVFLYQKAMNNWSNNKVASVTSVLALWAYAYAIGGFVFAVAAPLASIWMSAVTVGLIGACALVAVQAVCSVAFYGISYVDRLCNSAAVGMVKTIGWLSNQRIVVAVAAPVLNKYDKLNDKLNERRKAPRNEELWGTVVSVS